MNQLDGKGQRIRATRQITARSPYGVLSTSLQRRAFSSIIIRVFTIRLRDYTSDWRRPVDFVRSFAWNRNHW